MSLASDYFERRRALRISTPAVSSPIPAESELALISGTLTVDVARRGALAADTTATTRANSPACFAEFVIASS